MRPIVRRLVVTTALGVLLLALLLANSLVTFARFDLTENRVHTISDATRAVVRELEHELTLTYFLSDRLREAYPQPLEVIDLLVEYEEVARPAIRVRVVDPRELDDPTRAEALGVVPQQLQTSDEGEQSVAVVYSGIVIEYLDRRDALPFVFGGSTLEYELTSAISGLVRDDPRDVVFVVGNRSESLEQAYRLVAGDLARTFDVTTRAPGEIVADATEVVIVTDAQRLTAREVDALADYLARGGAALVAFEAAEVDLSGDSTAEAARSAPIGGLLRENGIVVGDELVLDESNNAITVEEASEDGSFRLTRAYPYPHWVAVREQYTSASHPVTARFPGLDLFWPTWLAVDEGSGAQIIAASTPDAWLMREPFVFDPAREDDLRRDAAGTRGQYGVVAVAGGTAEGVGRLAVVSDTDFLRDALVRASGGAHNVELTRNLVDWLADDAALLSIRTRSQRDLSLDGVAEPSRARTVRFVARAVNIVLVPAGVVLFGVVRLARRRKRSRGGGGR